MVCFKSFWGWSSSHNSIAMDEFNQLFDNFSMLIRQLLNDLPALSKFAQPSVWPKVQKTTPILCLRPPNARGLPLTTLHHVFCRFQYESSRPLPMTTETVAVQIAASKLCLRMGEAFKNVAERGEAFVDGILEKGEAECKFQPYPTSHYDKIDRCIIYRYSFARISWNLDLEALMHTCNLLAVTTWLWEFSLVRLRLIQMPTTISLTEHHVSWSVLWVSSVVYSSSHLLMWFA